MYINERADQPIEHLYLIYYLMPMVVCRTVPSPATNIMVPTIFPNPTSPWGIHRASVKRGGADSRPPAPEVRKCCSDRNRVGWGIDVILLV